MATLRDVVNYYGYISDEHRELVKTLAWDRLRFGVNGSNDPTEAMRLLLEDKDAYEKMKKTLMDKHKEQRKEFLDKYNCLLEQVDDDTVTILFTLNVGFKFGVQAACPVTDKRIYDEIFDFIFDRIQEYQDWYAQNEME